MCLSEEGTERLAGTEVSIAHTETTNYKNTPIENVGKKLAKL